MRRMDRYNDDKINTQKRSEKNRDLYQNINNRYTNITDVTNANVYELGMNDKKSIREDYHQRKKYQNVEPVPKVKKDLDDFNHLYQKDTKKIYDINSVLKEARKNKEQNDKLEEKRKLKHTSYNVFAGLNLEELMKYREEKKNRKITEDEQELRELIDTIASKTLAGEIDKATTVDLLSDLMATNVLDKVDGADELASDEDEEDDDENEDTSTKNDIISKEQLDEAEKKLEEETLSGADKDFYTRSMDLSEEDFDMDDEFVDKKLPLIVKIILFILIIAIVAAATYFIYNKLR